MNDPAPNPTTDKDRAAPPSPEIPGAGALVRLLRWLASAVPTAIILALLAALAWWGHHTGWKLDSFAALTSQTGKNEDDWCDEHDVPESECVLCTPGLMNMPKSHGWCAKHGVYDCPFENPEVAQLTTPAPITKADLTRAKKALDFASRAENNSHCKLHPTLVQVASTKEALDKLGLKFEPVWTAPVEEAITANGEVAYDQTQVASVSSIMPGKVWRVEKALGDHVQKGDILALIEAVEVGKAKTAFLQAVAELELRQKTLQRLKDLGKELAPAATVLEAEVQLKKADTDLLSAQQTLMNLGLPVTAEQWLGLSAKELYQKIQFFGLPDTVVQGLDPKTTPGNLLPLRSPLAGEIVERKIVAGEMTDPAKPLFVVANTQSVWLKLAVPAGDAKYLKKGQHVRFKHDSADKEAKGTLTWVSTAVDEKTRTVQARAELPNLDGQLRANTFGTSTIVLRHEAEALIVPRSAVHSDGNCQIVFVQDKNFHKNGHPKVFHVRTVRTGTVNGDRVEIIAGVLKGEIVVTDGSGALRTQLLKNNLGAG